MLPTIVTSSGLRKNLASVLASTTDNIVIIKNKGSNKVLLDESEYNRLSALANQFSAEDPEGAYRIKFEKEILERAKSGKIAPVTSLKKLL